MDTFSAPPPIKPACHYPHLPSLCSSSGRSDQRTDSSTQLEPSRSKYLKLQGCPAERISAVSGQQLATLTYWCHISCWNDVGVWRVYGTSSCV